MESYLLPHTKKPVNCLQANMYKIILKSGWKQLRCYFSSAELICIDVESASVDRAEHVTRRNLLGLASGEGVDQMSESAQSKIMLCGTLLK